MSYLVNQIPDTVMTDTVQEQLFTLVSSERSPFRGLSEWPWLDELLRERSKEILEKHGEVSWQMAGGKLNPQGKPTLDLRSDTVEAMLGEVEENYGGILFHDEDGTTWALKLRTLCHNSVRSRFGYGITWWRESPNVLDPLVRERCHDLAYQKSELKETLNKVATNILVYRRSEQLLWLIHFQVLAQRSSIVTIPDVSIGEMFWGERRRWPQNWRRDIRRALISLTGLHSQALRFVGNGWQPQLNSHSVALANIKFISTNSSDSPNCPPCCLLHSSERRHGHYEVQVGRGFLGVLENYLTNVDGDRCRYDFKREPSGESGTLLKASRNEGQIATTNLPLKLLGPAKFSGFSRRVQQLLAGLFREVTRRKKGKTLEEIRNRQVIGSSIKEVVKCPSLDPSQTYVVFGGNGHRRGCGYQVIGRSRTGWLSKCGYEIGAANDQEMRRFARKWLKDLRKLECELGFKVVGLLPRSKEWFDLEKMQQLTHHKASWNRLQLLHIRVYAPSDYEARLRKLLMDRAGLASYEALSQDNQDCSNFGERFARLGIKQQVLADYLGTSRPYVSKLLNGGKWPADRAAQVETWLISMEART
ncbi:helix-turn-helix transcriptional regulator [Bremerella sp. T1]|uniref:helix-turn-helix transcriptional regulator n=1 Tax=Bremerella sp. TYQ1 TaxID=3119568 RepID=UPI001CCA3B16|nr:helix-turn-helix transcriptional regulator [Bremerella volcania]UBM33763.1 helix-turn-helix domain-containing protein [Bremerella volcania]